MTNNEPLTYEQLGEMDPIRLRDVAWAEIQRLRAEPRALLLRLAVEYGGNNDIDLYVQEWLRQKAREL